MGACECGLLPSLAADVRSLNQSHQNANPHSQADATGSPRLPACPPLRAAERRREARAAPWIDVPPGIPSADRAGKCSSDPKGMGPNRWLVPLPKVRDNLRSGPGICDVRDPGNVHLRVRPGDCEVGTLY